MDALPARRVLLATNLTSRCDRATERAAFLARSLQAELHVVHVVTADPPPVPTGIEADRYTRRWPDPHHEAARLLRRDLRPETLGAKVHLESGAAPAAAILAVCQREGCDLIVLGETRDRLLGPLLESVTEQVVRKAPVSVLAVRDRCHGPYRDLLVGTDFTDEAAQSLVAAAGWFPDATITVLHAHNLPYSHLTGEASASEESARLLTQLHHVLESLPVSTDRRSAMRCVVASGAPEAMLRQHIVLNDTDLTVIGAHPRGLLFDTIVGNTRRILDAIPGDVLVVRASKIAAETG